MFNLLWLQSAGCGGCSMSLLNAESPDLLTTFEAAGIHLLWHPSLSEETGSEVVDIFDSILKGETQLDVLCLEGSVLRGPNGTGRFHMLGGTDKPMMEWIELLSKQAQYTVAVGSCAAFGGISAAGDNITDAIGLQFEGEVPGGFLGDQYRSLSGHKTINISGCPVHPDWVTETLISLSLDEHSEEAVDLFGRPRMYADQLVHHGCSRNEYYEYKASAELPGDRGCMMENMGCLGTQAHADCNSRPWNGVGSCTKGGYACINCTAPEFEEPGHSFTQTPKIAGIPVGLPTDMPKAWFVALASLSKAATPERLRKNATSEKLIYPPTIHKRKN
ncbi:MULTISPECIES: HupU protein [unclassified Neptuniibacter]|uniref:NADH-quinone oxidoreductase subunit B family protein n=1 Tax=unclassified Neptuniibacter TaxID=2630693 RepID=UPI000C4CAAC7|nr:MULTISPECIES: HupU protein [unclassified Neptuniibacter]MAY42586.1 HupU protein [Oceanospirillaceae bacterium]